MSQDDSTFTVCLTHDVDRVTKSWQYLTHDVRNGRFGRLKALFNGERPYWMFERLMETEESYGVRSTFFFLEESMRARLSSPRTWKLAYGRYSYDDPEIRRVIRDLDEGGWEIGVHGSYLSYRSLDLLRQEKDRLEQVMGKEVHGIRQHYLNLLEPRTWDLQKAAGFKYDASLGRIEGIGFKDARIGPFYHEDTSMVILPLTLMECYLFREAKGDKQEALRLDIKWMDYAMENNVPFSILWHQRMFNEDEFPGYAFIYRELLAESKRRDARVVKCAEVADCVLAKVENSAI